MALLNITDSAVKSLKTPDDFIKTYQDQLKDITQSNNIQISKVGFIGYFLNILGELQYDVKQYYDFLFMESFPITATQSTNLKLHSQLHNYDILNAKPALLNGDISININSINNLTGSIVSRKINIVDLDFWIDDLHYVSDSTINLEIARINGELIYTAEILTPTDQKLYTINPVSPIIPITETYQRETEEQVHFIPNYSYGTHYTLEIPLDDIQLETIEVFIDGVQYETRTTKLNANADDLIVFFEVLSDGVLKITTGSGIQGFHVPNTELILNLITTKGSKGNIGKISVLDVAGTMTVLDYDVGGVLLPTQRYPDIQSVITLNISDGIGGKDALTGDALRKELISHIQTKDNLVSETDFKNILDSIFSVFDFIFKKTDLMDNNIYCYVPLYDDFLIPLCTLTQNVDEPEFVSQVIGDFIPYPEFVINGKDMISPFVYRLNTLYNRYDAFVLNEEVTFNITSNEYADGITDAPPLIYMELLYDVSANETEVNIRSFQPIDIYTFKLLTPIDGTTITVLDFSYDNIEEKHTLVFDGIISTSQTIYIKIFNSNLIIPDYTSKFENVLQLHDITDYLNLKHYYDSISGLTKLLYLPLVEKDKFILDSLNYKLKLLSQLVSLDLSVNRMVSDDVQLRTLNTAFIDSSILQEYTLQQLNQILTFPLKLDIDLILHKQIIINERLDSEVIVDGLKEVIINFILEEKTGTSLSFYKTEVIDICHNYHFIKSAAIILKDANDVIIQNGNIETIKFTDLVKKLTRNQILDLTPMLFHWDINEGINTNYTIT